MRLLFQSVSECVLDDCAEPRQKKKKSASCTAFSGFVFSYRLTYAFSQKLYFGCNSGWGVKTDFCLDFRLFFLFRQYVSIDRFLNAPYRFFFFFFFFFPLPQTHSTNASSDTRLAFYRFGLFSPPAPYSHVPSYCLHLPESFSQARQKWMRRSGWRRVGGGNGKQELLRYQDSGWEFTVTDFDGIDKMLSASS